MSKRTFMIFALLLPLVGFVTAIALGEMRYRRAREIDVPISGYDPTDLVRGHYVQYRLTTESANESSASYERACVRTNAGRDVVVLFNQSRPNDCYAELRIDFVREPHRIYVQQESAPALERALNAGRARVVLAEVDPGHWVGRRMLVDGVPWQNARLDDD